jgi:cell division protein ZapE
MGLRDIYQTRIADQGLKPDAGQAHVVDALHDLAERLQSQQGGFLKRIFAGKPDAVRGLYIHGEVGRGKTMLMDLFFDTVQVPKKRRVHFHAFMQDVHRRRTAAKSDDVIATLADQLAADATLLCLDEMQIVDIADAMIIGRLYEALLQRGVTLVTTSNLQPEGLYKDGLNRDLFLPFIAKLRGSMDVVTLTSARDYRLGRVRSRETYLCPATAENRVAFNALWNDLTDDAAGRAETLEILGRKLVVPKAAHGCAAFTFTELCGQPLGPPDYLAITKAYRTVFVSGLARFQEHQRNEAKRFILMIDTFYDVGLRIVALADAMPEDLAPPGQHGFEFQRTVSRLKEMQAASWWVNHQGET